MSSNTTAECLIIGTGDGLLNNNLCKYDEHAPLNSMARNILIEIMDNAMQIADHKSDKRIVNKMEKSFENLDLSHETGAACFIGTGDPISCEKQETVHTHPQVEKKSRLTDLVKNSRKLLARIINEKKTDSQEDKIENEEILKVIEPTDCWHQQQQQHEEINNENDPFKLCSTSSDTIFSSQDSFQAIPNTISYDTIDLSAPSSSASTTLTGSKSFGSELMAKKNCTPTNRCSSAGGGLSLRKKTFTLPRVSGSKIKMSLASKYGTLKRGTINIKEKKWNVGDKMASFFHMARGNKDKKQKNACEMTKIDKEMQKNSKETEKEEFVEKKL